MNNEKENMCKDVESISNNTDLDFEAKIALALSAISGSKSNISAQPSKKLERMETKQKRSYTSNNLVRPNSDTCQCGFDTFVAFDIETTGTYGSCNNDGPQEITEIGAVKVVNGYIVDRYNELVNPHREITPIVQRLTGITNEMVAGKPPIEEVILRFKKFVGDNIMLGHNIVSFDLPYIYKAAEKAGIRFDNQVFDTYRYARTFQKRYGWDSCKLGYLAKWFGIEITDAHRAWCDAEANAKLYLKMIE